MIYNVLDENISLEQAIHCIRSLADKFNYEISGREAGFRAVGKYFTISIDSEPEIFSIILKSNGQTEDQLIKTWYKENVRERQV